MIESDNSTRRRPVRWWPLWVIGILAVVALVFVWEFRDAYRQEKNIFSAIISMITLGLMLLWWTFFSRIKWKLRLGGILAVAVGPDWGLGRFTGTRFTATRRPLESSPGPGVA